MRFLLFPLALLCLTSCVKNKSKHELGKPWTVLEGNYNKGVEKRYSPQSILMVETPYLNSKPHGLKKEYYSDGSLHRITPIENGYVNGTIKEYYKSGSLYKESPVAKGKTDGVVKKYHTNGVLMSEAIYKRGRPQKGLKEYDETGKIKEAPEIVITGKNNIQRNGTYLIELSVPSVSSRVKYYLITNFEGKEKAVPIPTELGKGVYSVTIPKETSVNKELLFEYKFVTLYGNICILRKTYKLKVP